MSAMLWIIIGEKVLKWVMRGAYEWLVYVTGMVKEREKILSKYSNI
jgi:hypothetical protein